MPYLTEFFSCVTSTSSRRLLGGGFDVVCFKVFIYFSKNNFFFSEDLHQNVFFLILHSKTENLSSLTLNTYITALILVTEGF